MDRQKQTNRQTDEWTDTPETDKQEGRLMDAWLNENNMPAIL